MILPSLLGEESIGSKGSKESGSKESNGSEEFLIGSKESTRLEESIGFNSFEV